jgi:superfamily II DNA or RNA helicase
VRFTLDDIRASFGEMMFRRGVNYARNGNVVQLEVSEGNASIEGRVRGSQPVPYAVTVDISANSRGRARLSGFCDCPIEYNCKHAVAAAVAALDRRGRDDAPHGEDRYDPTDPAVEDWLRRLGAYRAPAAPAHRDEHIRYLLDLADGAAAYATLTARVVKVLQSGELSAGRAVDLQNLNYAGGAYVTPIDRTIGRLANASGVSGQYAWAQRGANISPRIMAVLLDELLQTGRLHWRSTKAPALARADLPEQRMTWHLDANGRQRPSVEGRASLRLLETNPPWYVDPERGEAGLIDLSISPEVTALLASAPPLSPRQARRAHATWHRIFGRNGMPPPQTDVETEIVERDPVPMLRLRGSIDLSAFAELTFAYGRHRVRPGDETPEFQEGGDGRVLIWPRRPEFETSARDVLAKQGLVPLAWLERESVDRRSCMLHFPGTSERRWAHLLDVVVPHLRESGWVIEVDPSFPFELVEAGDWDARIEANENRWFDFDLGIDVAGERLSLLPIVVDALRDLGISSAPQLAKLGDGAAVYGRLPSGAFVALPAARIAPILATLVELLDAPLSDEGRLALTPAHVASIQQLEAAMPVRWGGATALRDLLNALATGAETQRVTLPATFKGVLRPYQERGVAWLRLLHKAGFGGVLADDMGLGKTVQFLAYLALERSRKRVRGPVLIVSPTSVLPNWRAEIARFVPRLRVLTLSGADRFGRMAQIDHSDVVLTSYALLQRDIDELCKHEWQIAVLDEAQAIKNPRSKGAQAAARLRAGQRLALTGTPMENHLGELWSIFGFAVPGLLGEHAAFTRAFRTPIEKRGDAERRALLAARLRPFLLRRTKENVALDLPEKSEIVVPIELDGAQRDLYETIRIAMHERVRSELQRRGLARSRIVVLDALLKLRQVCCDPRLVKLAAARNVRESRKLEALLDMLPELIEEGRRILLFSQFTSMLDLIKPELVRRNIDFVELRGDTRDRVTPVERFQAGEVPLFLISLKAGGTGLNLTAADTVIHYDPWWNPAVERQATDRAHRIGQQRPVFVYKLVTSGTVEERIIDLQQRKAELAAGIFGESASATLDAGEIDRLFAPI